MKQGSYPLLPSTSITFFFRTINETPPHPIHPSSGTVLYLVLHEEEHGIDTSVAILCNAL